MAMADSSNGNGRRVVNLIFFVVTHPSNLKVIVNERIKDGHRLFFSHFLLVLFASCEYGIANVSALL
jgi:hypothetical protein